MASVESEPTGEHHPPVVCALTTPFTATGEVDDVAFRRQLRMVAPYVNSVFVSGTTGEFPALSEAERLVLFAAALAELGSDRVIAHIGAPDTRAAVRIAVNAAGSGVRRMAALTPYYLPVSVDEVHRHFATICEAVDADVLAYVFPERTGVRMRPQDYAAIAGEHGVVGVKLSGESAARIGDYVAAAPGTAVYSGNDADLPIVLACGGAGIISGCSSAFPEAFGDADATGAVVDALGASVGLVKYAQRSRGLCGATARMAVQPPGSAQRAAIDELVSRYGKFEAPNAG